MICFTWKPLGREAAGEKLGRLVTDPAGSLSMQRKPSSAKAKDFGRFLAILSLMGSATLCATAVDAQPIRTSPNSCELFSNADWTGPSKKFEVASNKSGNAWATAGIRGAGRGDLTPVVYDNVESLLVNASSSDVVLYIFDGDHFDGNFQALRAERGKTLKWRLGSMRNKASSFICQNDDFVPVNLSGIQEFMTNSLLPTGFFADYITAEVHDLVRQQRSRFYDHKIDLKYGRLSWDTRLNTCQAIQCASPLTSKDKYLDYLRYDYKGSGRLKADGKRYDMYLTLWFEPVLSSGGLTLEQRAWNVNVSNWIWHKRIEDEISKGVRDLFKDDGLTTLVSLKLRGAIASQAGNLGTSILNNNRKLILSHPCVYFAQRTGYPGHAFTPTQVNEFCAGTTPAVVASPGIRLIK